MTLAEQIATDQDAVFFNRDDFAVQAEIEGVTITVLLHDLIHQDGPMDGILVDRKRLLIQPDAINWTPVTGMEISVNGHLYIIEQAGGGMHSADDGLLPWDLQLVRYVS